MNFTLIRQHSHAHEHVPADYWSGSECLSSDTTQRKWFQGCHSTDSHSGTLWFRRNCTSYSASTLQSKRLTINQCMIIAAKLSDRFGNRGWPTQFGWMLLIVGFVIFLGTPTSNKPAHFAALVLAETGHYSMFSTSCTSNAFLTVRSSLYSTDRHLVCQQRR